MANAALRLVPHTRPIGVRLTLLVAFHAAYQTASLKLMSVAEISPFLRRLRRDGSPPEVFRPERDRETGGLSRLGLRDRPLRWGSPLAGSRRPRQEGGDEELLLDLYYSDISPAMAEEVIRSKWSGDAGSGSVFDRAKMIARRIDRWLRRKISSPQKYVFLQSAALKRQVQGRTKITDVLVAIGVGNNGRYEVLAVSISGATGEEPWSRLVLNLKKRGLRGTELFLGPNDLMACNAVSTHFPGALYQGDIERLQSEVIWMVSAANIPSVVNAFAVTRADDLRTAIAETARLVESLRADGEFRAAMFLEKAFPFQFNYHHFPKKHWPLLRDSGPMKRPLHELRRWMRARGPVADDRALELMIAARMRHLARCA